MDQSWTEEIQMRDEPVLIIIEGLTMYMTEQEAKQILEIKKRFTKVTVLVETISPFMAIISKKSQLNEVRRNSNEA